MLPPDFEGRFQPLAHKTTFKLAEILEKFPLPQRVLMIPSNEHSERLLDILLSTDDGDVRTFLLKQKSEAEYVIGVDNHGQNAVLMDIDAKVNFYPPISTNDRDFVLRISGQEGHNIADLRLDQVICKVGDKIILCKQWKQVFKNPPPVLAVKRPSTKKKPAQAPKNQLGKLSLFVVVVLDDVVCLFVL